jgi:transposase
MARRMLTEKMWNAMEPKVIQARGNMGAPPKQELREFLEAVLYLLRTGCPWRDLPEEFGRWHTIYMRFRRWEEAGVWERLFGLMQVKNKKEFLKILIDSMIIPVHPHAAGASKKRASSRLWDALGEGRRQKYTPPPAAHAVRSR